MILTREFIFSGRSEAGGWNRPQIELLRMPWPPTQGWIDRIVGKTIPDEDAEQFLKLRGWLSPTTRRKYEKLKRWRQPPNSFRQSAKSNLALAVPNILTRKAYDFASGEINML
jgi:hypothetical protein